MKTVFKEKKNMRKLPVRLLMMGFIAVCAVFFGTGCGKSYADYSFDFFDTVSVITGYEKSEEEFKKTISEVHNVLRKCHQEYNIYISYEGVNNVLMINKVDRTTGMHSPVKVSKETWDMLMFGKKMYELTNGRTNIAMGSVLSIWHKAREFGSNNPESAYLPDMEKLKEAANHTSFDTIEFDEDTMTVYLPDSAQSFDVGAVAKGYGIEMAAQYLIEQGKTGYCLNIGGNIRTIGLKDNKEKWGVGLENPYYEGGENSKEEPYIAILELADMAMATSGSYQRYYYVDGKPYHHIIDPDTLMPENRWISVSVISNHAGLSDGLSTALFNMSYEEGSALIESLENVEALWMSPDREIKKSSGFENYERKTEK